MGTGHGSSILAAICFVPSPRTPPHRTTFLSFFSSKRAPVQENVHASTRGEGSGGGRVCCSKKEGGGKERGESKGGAANDVWGAPRRRLGFYYDLAGCSALGLPCLVFSLGVVGIINSTV